MDDEGNATPVTIKSYKSWRVTRSVLAAEVIAFADLFDNAYSIRPSLEQELGRLVPLYFLTDSKYLYDIISKGSRPSEKHLMLDVYATREAYCSKEMCKIGIVRSQHNISDG